MKTKLIQLICFAALFRLSFASGQNWVETSAPSNYWNRVASSADGIKLVAVAGSGGGIGCVYTSADSGATWVSNNVPNTTWSAVACSRDGCRIVAVANSGLVYLSTNFGSQWIQSTNAPSAYWNSCASSADGTIDIAVNESPTAYVSTNSGLTWQPSRSVSSTVLALTAVAISADGGLMAVGAQFNSFGSSIFVSTNLGMSWRTNSESTFPVQSITASTNGAFLAASSPGFGIFISTNFGVTWSNGNLNAAYVVTSSSDGSKLAAFERASNNPIFRSIDFGATWMLTSAPSNDWHSIASSADGTKLVIVDRGETTGGGGIYVWQPPQLSIASSDSGLAITWPTNVGNFILQENSALRTTNWTDVTNDAAILNDQYEILVSPEDPENFYRLRSF